jgi:tyrosine-protein kinase Etk/Wzc
MSNKEASNSQSVNLLDFSLTAARYKGSAFLIIFSITLVALIVSLFWPHTYKSSVKFTQYDVSEAGGLSGLIGNIVQMPTMSDRVSAEQALIILRSRSMLDRVIDEFDLHEVYGMEVREYVREQLSNNTIISENREGGIGFSPIVSIDLSFLDRDPERAQRIAAYYIEQLDDIITEINRSNTQMTFEMFERRYQENMRDMEAAESAMVQFQRQYGILELESQLKSMIENIGEVKASIIAMDVQLNVARATMSSDASRVRELQSKRNELEGVYRDMIRRTETQAVDGEIFQEEADIEDIFPPLMNVPDLGVQYMRHYRELMVQEKIFELVYPQYEQHRLMIQEAKSGLQVIDEPVVPTYKDSPSRALITIAGFLFSIIVAFFFIYFSEFIRKGSEENSENYQKYQALKRELSFKRQ